MTLAEAKDLIIFAREQRVQEISVDGVHVMFQVGADMPRIPQSVVNLPQTEAEAKPLEEGEAEKLLAGDPDLFSHVDGRPDIIEEPVQ